MKVGVNLINHGPGVRRTVCCGDGWHPNNFRLDWLREEGLPRLKEISREGGKPVPSLCPRIRLRLTESLLDEERRLPGEGTLDQVRADLDALDSLGAEYVLLDTYYTATRRRRGTTNAPGTSWRRWPRASWTSKTGGCVDPTRKAVPAVSRLTGKPAERKGRQALPRSG